ncbi:dihydrolipoamide acetyltransferase family protein [Rhizomicrobium electricum]|uniref:Dihydrolipoamide acetyltransferase component of pyruvate dehydrogenase complex n=1 Tax=Rhizomicrobium electricum TaxID=480070 RepID=A0ABN1E8N3_9PROT|nr:dihydrolipoamide acetyltransferase family protein [Rhizomicrobium electricum]NIJ47813.1 2-oxoisovalerate dehydrogenase E2 component (dihydrolipoyl transacylase) [Rhizomicrobium electricum]
MRYTFKLPDVGEGTAEAEIVAWHVAIGDRVAEDQHLVDVMTDKATVEMTSPVAGTVIALKGKPGDMATVGAPLVEFETEATAQALPPETPLPSDADADRLDAEQPKKTLASPAVRLRAADLGIMLDKVHGTGPGGRVTHGDIDDYLSATGSRPQTPPPVQQPAAATREAVEEIKLVGLRRRIAERMQEAKRRIPHFAYVEEIDMTELEDLRAHLNATRSAERPKLTVLPLLLRALVRVLPQFPQINAHFDDEAGVVRRYTAIHAGVATQTDAGLMVPVVRNAERRDLWDAAAEIARLAERARSGRAAKDELTGSTITITSLGPMGGLATTPIINMPEVAIIAPNAIMPRPVVRDGTVVVRKMMNLSSCYDHRVIDGADAAAFVQRLKTLLEHPALLFMD